MQGSVVQCRSLQCRAGQCRLGQCSVGQGRAGQVREGDRALSAALRPSIGPEEGLGLCGTVLHRANHSLGGSSSVTTINYISLAPRNVDLLVGLYC